MSITDGKLDSLLVLYSSQTGTAESIAELFVNEDLVDLCNKPRVVNIAAYMKEDKDLSLFAKEKLVVMVIATTGDGDFPDSALPFMRIVRRMDKKVVADNITAHSELPFANVALINLGLGDSNYNKFNGGIQQVERLLTKLGCRKAQRTILADDGIGLEMGVEQWRKATKEFLTKYIADPTTLDTVLAASAPVAKPVPTNTALDAVASIIAESSTDTATTTTTGGVASTRLVPQRHDIVIDETKTPIFAAPDTSSPPPVGVTKPQFLIKKQDYRIDTYLTTPDHFNKQIQQIDAPISAVATTTPAARVFDITKLKQKQIDATTDDVVQKYNTIQNEDGNITLFSANQLLLQQYAAVNNLCAYTTTASDDAVKKQVYTTLYRQEFGYSNLSNNPPLFGTLADINYPVFNTEKEQYPEIKNVVELDLQLEQHVVEMFAEMNTYKISMDKDSNSNTTVATLPISQYLTTEQFVVAAGGSIEKMSDDIDNTAVSNNIEVVNLYRPGDSISIICPNTYTTTNTILSATKQDKYRQHGVIITQTQNAQQSITIAADGQQSINTPTYPVKESANHDVVPQPAESLINTIIAPQKDEKTEEFIKNILSIGNILYNVNTNVDFYTTEDEYQYCFASILPTLEDVLTYSVDLTSPIKKAIVRAICEHCTIYKKQFSNGDEPNNNDNEQEYALYQTFNLYQQYIVELLYELMSKAGRDKLKQFIDDKSLTLVEFLNLFQFKYQKTQGDDVVQIINTLQPTLQMLLELCATLKPRSYSISTSPYKYITNLNDHQIYTLDNIEDISKLQQQVATQQQEGGKKTTLITGQYIRFAASMTTAELPQIDNIPPATYKEATPYDATKLKVNDNLNVITRPDGFTQHNGNADDKRIYNGLCTHWYAELYQDYQDLLQLSSQSDECTGGAIKIEYEQFLQFLKTKKYDNTNKASSPYRFYGCLLNYNHITESVTILLPFFFHTTPTFHPPAVLTTLIQQPTTIQPQDKNIIDLAKDKDMLLFGPGTGSSPFLSFIEHKLYTNIFQQQILQQDKQNNILPSYWCEPKQYYTNNIIAQNIIAYNNNDDVNNKLTTLYNQSINIVDNQISTIAVQNKNNTTSTTDTQHSNNNTITLFTGNRYRTKDYLYNYQYFNHLSTTQQSLNYLYSVFSREATNENNNNIKYVQDLITQHSYNIARHIFTGGFIYVCGDGAVMSKQLQKALEACVAKHCADEELVKLYTLQHDVNVQTKKCYYNPNAVVSPQLLTYVSKNPLEMKTQVEREAWARGVIAVMVQSGRYNTDVCSM